MTLFESIVSACAVAYTFTKVYDFCQWQIDLRSAKERDDGR